MKRSEYRKQLTDYLLKRDVHLALNRTQAEQLVHYVMLFNDDIDMLPPCYEYIKIDGLDENGHFLKEEGICNEWESEDE